MRSGPGDEYGPAWSPGPGEPGTDGPHVVLAGVGGSPTALRAGAYAAGLARRQRSRLVLVSVPAPSAWAGMATATSRAAQEQSCEAIIDAPGGRPAARRPRRGGASESKGRRIVGSVANRLVRAGLWPVAVAP